MKINAIYVKDTFEILYSRSRRDYRESSNKQCAVDGGLEYFKVNFKDESDIIFIELDGDVLLSQILEYDYKYGNSNADLFPNGFCGRFVLYDSSNAYFYMKLITKGFNEVWESRNGKFS